MPCRGQKVTTVAAAEDADMRKVRDRFEKGRGEEDGEGDDSS